MSQIYDILLFVASPSLNRLKSKWEDDFVRWFQVKPGSHPGLESTQPTCVSYNAIQFKILHTLHLSRKRLTQNLTQPVSNVAKTKHPFSSYFRHAFGTKICETFSYISNEAIDPEPKFPNIWLDSQRSETLLSPEPSSGLFVTVRKTPHFAQLEI